MIATTRILGCSQCGGTTQPVPGRSYHQCSYCQSLVFSTADPLNVDRILVVDGEIEALCPCCEGELRKGNAEGVPVLYCGRCYGFLLKNEHFGSLVRQRRAARAGQERETVRPLDPAQYQRQIRCPACRGVMEAHPYYGPGNVVIDSCSACHYVWLDHGELRTIERAEGGREPAPLPMFVSEAGEVTVIPPPQR